MSITNGKIGSISDLTVISNGSGVPINAPQKAPAGQGATTEDMNRGFIIGTCDARSTPGKYPCSQHAGHNGWHQWETRNGSNGTFSVEPLPAPSAPAEVRKCNATHDGQCLAAMDDTISCDAPDCLVTLPPSAPAEDKEQL